MVEILRVLNQPAPESPRRSLVSRERRRTVLEMADQNAEFGFVAGLKKRAKKKNAPKLTE